MLQQKRNKKFSWNYVFWPLESPMTTYVVIIEKPIYNRGRDSEIST